MVNGHFLELDNFFNHRSCRIVSSSRSKCNFANQNYYMHLARNYETSNIQTDNKTLNESICVLHFSSWYQLHETLDVSLNIPDHSFCRLLATVMIKILSWQSIANSHIECIPSSYIFIAYIIKILISGRPLRSNFFVCILGFGNAKS